MYTQLLLGISMLVTATCHACGVRRILGEKARAWLEDHELAAYQRGMIAPHYMLGLLFIGMGLIDW